MKRISSEAQFYENGTVVIDADGVVVSISSIDAAIAALNTRATELEYDTGWRNVTGSLINGWTATYVHVRRTGRRGVVRFQGLNGAAATSPYFVQIPAGFFAGGQNILAPIGAASTVLWVLGNGTQLSLPTTTPSSSVVTTAEQYLGDLAKPATLPGTPA